MTNENYMKLGLVYKLISPKYVKIIKRGITITEFPNRYLTTGTLTPYYNQLGQWEPNIRKYPNTYAYVSELVSQ